MRDLVPYALKEGNSKKPIYQMHKWWARRLSSVFRSILIGAYLGEDSTEQEFWNIFKNDEQLSNGTTLFDPFVGGGTTLVEGQRLGLTVSGCEIDPVAWFVTQQELSFAQSATLDEAFQQVQAEASPKIRPLYQTTGENGTKTDIVYGFWVSVIECPSCAHPIELHPHFQLHRNRKAREKSVFCSQCHSIQIVAIDENSIRCTDASCGTTTLIDQGNITRAGITCPNCGRDWPRQLLQRVDEPLNRVLFAVECLDVDVEGKPTTSYLKATETDQLTFEAAQAEWSERVSSVLWMQPFLHAPIPVDGRHDARPVNHGFLRYADLFNSRQLLALSYLGEAVKSVKDSSAQKLLMLALSDSLAANNMLCCYAFDYKKLTPLFGLHGYQIVTRPVENNFWGTLRGRGSFASCFYKARRGILSKSWSESIRNQESEQRYQLNSGTFRYTNLQLGDSRFLTIADASIDLICTDPPYFDNLQYGELSDFFYQWLKPFFQAKFPDEMFPDNCVQLSGSLIEGGDADEGNVSFATKLGEVFTECARILKSDGLLIFTFHYRNSVAWHAVESALVMARFYVTNVFPVRSEGRSGFHSSSGNLKWDDVFVCRKVQVGPPTFQLPRPSFDAESAVAHWKESLMDIDGAPNDADWRSLANALVTAARVNEAASCTTPLAKGSALDV